MAKRKPSPKTQPAAKPSPPSSPAPALPPVVASTQWGWMIGGLIAAIVLMAGVIWGLQQWTPPSGNAVAQLLSATPTVVPTPTTHTRPATAPPGLVDYCKRSPQFRDTEGFSTRAVLSTAERGVMGARMIDLDPTGQVINQYQHPSWDDAGYLGHVLLDRMGNVYTFPAPYVSLLDNPPELQNIVYRIDSFTAAMTRFYTLTAPAPPTSENPFGLMGLAYDCDTESLYAASVAGSTRAETVGEIVRIDLASREVRFRYEGVDAFGLGIYITPPFSGTVSSGTISSGTVAVGVTTPVSTVVSSGAVNGGKRLYYGLARSSEIYSIGIDEKGDLLDDVRQEITLPDPTLKARRIVFAQDGTMEVRSRPFEFTLIVTSERPEVLFYYRFDPATNRWQLSTAN
ncbi:MAG: hypothetical protein KF832_05375 [Caldilineaceae bacterium]|nr:hypothetical protein [Caldilineaceae bacterium]